MACLSAMATGVNNELYKNRDNSKSAIKEGIIDGCK